MSVEFDKSDKLDLSNKRSQISLNKDFQSFVYLKFRIKSIKENIGQKIEYSKK
jgi:hypothetical protein